MTVSLDKKWKDFLYGSCFFGPNLLFVLLGACFTDSLNPAGLTANLESWSMTGYALIVPGLFGAVWMVSKFFDGLIDIPLASLTDNIRTRRGRRRPVLLPLSPEETEAQLKLILNFLY